MIIWGSKGREIEQGRGEFYCPECNAEEGYKLIRIATYFTLYFIPLFETEHHGTFVKCFGCNNHFKKEVLDLEPPSPVQRALMSVRSSMESGKAVEEARKDLVASGVESETADQLIGAAVSDDNVNTCKACALTFLSNIRKCSGCGGKVGWRVSR